MYEDGFDIRYSDGEWLCQIDKEKAYSSARRPSSPMFTSYSECVAFALRTKSKYKWYIVRSGRRICREWDDRVIFSNDPKHPSHSEFGLPGVSVE